MPAAGSRVKSDARRHTVVEAAVTCFARKGFYGTTTDEIADRAGISQPYVYRLFANKQALFAQAVEHVSERMASALRGSSPPDGQVTPSTTQVDVQAAYSALIEDREILRFLMHANCAVDEPLVRDAVRACYAKQVELVRDLLDGDDEAVRRWFGAGMLDNVVTILDLAEDEAPWARTLAGR